MELFEKPRDCNFFPSYNYNEENIDDKTLIKELNNDIDIFKENCGGKAYDTIEEIEFAFVKLTRLKNICVFTNLKELTIINCPLNSLNGIENISNSLETLFVIGCELNSIEKSITKLKNLKVLSLGENKIKEIRNLHKYKL